jgi:hypothetical protein
MEHDSLRDQRGAARSDQDHVPREFLKADATAALLTPPANICTQKSNPAMSGLRPRISS